MREREQGKRRGAATISGKEPGAGGGAAAEPKSGGAGERSEGERGKGAGNSRAAKRGKKLEEDNRIEKGGERRRGGPLYPERGSNKSKTRFEGKFRCYKYFKRIYR